MAYNLNRPPCSATMEDTGRRWSGGGIVYNGIQYLWEYMSKKKEVTIGITINLENYENLRLEIEGDVETQQDADDLIAFLDGMLARLGRGDPATAERVDAYRRRVLTPPAREPEKPITPPAPGGTKTGTQEAAPPKPADTERSLPPEEKPCPSEIIETAIPPAPEHPHPPHAPKPPAGSPAKAAPAPKPAGQAPQKVEENPPAAPADAVCENCGVGIVKSQAKLSQLFTGKTLCKKCMEQP
jgi:hypothetical protein